MKIKTTTVIVLLVILVAVGYWYLKPKSPKEVLAFKEEQFQRYCGVCHTVPDPKNIPKSIWINNVLPEMAARMGYEYDNNIPVQSSMEERYYVKKSNAYPRTPMIDSVTWNLIKEYIVNLAPDSIPINPNRKKRNSELTQFSVTLDTASTKVLDQNLLHVHYNTPTHQFFTSDVFGNLLAVKESKAVTQKFNSPVVSTVLKDSALYVTEIGAMDPSEVPKGSIYKKDKKNLRLLSKGLHRPVYTQVNDLNEDSIEEIIICEFGYYTGELSMLVQKDSVFEKKTLSTLPGSIKVEIRDMNGDGKKDIVALFSQAREGLYILYQQNDLQFNQQQVISLPPEYGVSWFQMMDYDKDGDLDVVLANGDNADYSIFPKPYHGIRLFLNDGSNEFEQKWFYPIHGATRVLAEDFDADGDIDFAVLAFFVDLLKYPEEGFVYLENKNSKEFLFESFITPESKNGNWLVMDKGDFDADGDVDILLGGFSDNLQKTTKLEKGYNHLFLMNNKVN